MSSPQIPQSTFGIRAEDPWIETFDDMVAVYRLGSKATAIDISLELFRAFAGLPRMPHRVGAGVPPPTCRWKNSDMLRVLNNIENVKAMYQ